MARILMVLLIVCYSGFTAGASEDPAVDNKYLGRTPGLLFLPEREKLAAFRNMARITPTREVKRGNRVFELPTAPRDFRALRYRVEDEEYDLDDFVSQTDIVGLLVIKEGRIVLERYAHGNDGTSLWVSFSVAKSVVSMLVGAAIADGYIVSLDEKVTTYLPRLKGSSYDQVSVRDVIQMASGVAWDETYADPESDVNNMPGDILSLLRFVAGKERVAPPGDAFNYNTAETNLVGALLRSAIGNNLATYLTDKIWQPFGMEADANWLLHGPGGGEHGGCCISATLRDYGRLGLFAMRGGLLPDGTRVLPEKWMADSTTPSKGYEGYGYLWWLRPGGAYAAQGIFGQMIHIDPAAELVIVTHSAWDTAVGRSFGQHRGAFVAAATEFVRN